MDFNLIGVTDKWRFVSPTILSVTFVLLSIVGFLIPYVAKLYFSNSRKSSVASPLGSLRYNPSLFAKSTHLLVVAAYLFLVIFIFPDNYRLESGAMAKLVMGTLNTLLTSLTLILILIRKSVLNKNDMLIFVSLIALGMSLTGVGTFVVLLALSLLWVMSARRLDFRNLIYLIFGGLALIGVVLVFILTWKYDFDLMSISLDNIIAITGWVFQRISTVPASSVFLIENFYSDSPGFGFNGALDVLVNNAKRLVGNYSASSQVVPLGRLNFLMFYTGDGDVFAGISPGLIGGALYFFPWYLAAFASGLILFLILSLIAASWGRYFRNHNWFVNFIFFYFFILFLLLNPYAWLSVIDPGFSRFVVFLFAPVFFGLLCRIRLRTVI